MHPAFLTFTEVFAMCQHGAGCDEGAWLPLPVKAGVKGKPDALMFIC